MANKTQSSLVATLIPNILPKTPQMEAALRAGYPDLDVAKAKAIIKERRENPALWPYEQVQRAEAFLAAYEGVPLARQVIATRLGPERSQPQTD
jgi:hypothetical protein